MNHKQSELLIKIEILKFFYVPLPRARFTFKNVLVQDIVILFCHTNKTKQ